MPPQKLQPLAKLKANFHPSWTTITTPAKQLLLQTLTGKATKPVSTLPESLMPLRPNTMDSWLLNTKSMPPSVWLETRPQKCKLWMSLWSITTSYTLPTTWDTWTKWNWWETLETSTSSPLWKWWSSLQELKLHKLLTKKPATLLPIHTLKKWWWLASALNSLGAPKCNTHSYTLRTLSAVLSPPLVNSESEHCCQSKPTFWPADFTLFCVDTWSGPTKNQTRNNVVELFKTFAK